MTALQNLDHPNIIKMITSGEGDLVKPNGQIKKVMYIALELARGGELFDYIAQTGHLSMEATRFYFKQLIDALSFIHTNGYVHRDLKLENLLLDENFNLKVADFGFSAPVRGRDGSGLLTTVLGTP
jgi:serine/threonine protein kinase